MIVRFKAVLVITLHRTKKRKRYIFVFLYGVFIIFPDIFFECFRNLVESQKQFFFLIISFKI